MYKYYNPNPNGLKVGDCTVRAICKALNQDWDTTYTDLIAQGFMMKDMPSSDKVWGEYLVSKGYIRKMIPDTCPLCYTIADFCRDNPEGTYIVGTVKHVVTAIDGDYYDTWDSGDKTAVYYFVKLEN